MDKQIVLGDTPIKTREIKDVIEDDTIEVIGDVVEDDTIRVDDDLQEEDFVVEGFVDEEDTIKFLKSLGIEIEQD